MKERKFALKLYIIRHGETDMNRNAVLQGQTDSALNSSGIRLAVLTGRAMQGIHFDACISSPLKRARETAELVLKESGNGEISIREDSRIQEISFGVREGSRLETEGMDWNFWHHPLQFQGFEGGESMTEVLGRTGAFLKELVSRDDGRTYLISTHGCALRAMLNPLYDDPSDFWQGHAPYNCSVSIVEAEEGEMRLLADDRVYYDEKYIVDRYKYFND